MYADYIAASKKLKSLEEEVKDLYNRLEKAHKDLEEANTQIVRLMKLVTELSSKKSE